MPCQSMRMKRITSEIAASTSPLHTTLAGMMSRGKYTREMMRAEATSELLLSARVLAKNCHGSSAAKVMIS